MRIRTAVAAAALASAALLGSAGSAFADNSDNLTANNDHNNVRIDPTVVDFTDAILSRHNSVSDNDTTHNQSWKLTNISDNWTGNFSGNVHVGDLEFDD